MIEPYMEAKSRNGKGPRNHRRILKELDSHGYGYLHCSELRLGGEQLKILGGTGSPIYFDDYGMIQLFFDMMNAGWTVPKWLKDMDWNDLHLLTLNIADTEKLPRFTPQMPITITHSPNPIQHIIEKTVTLNTGKSHSFCFLDRHGDEVFCHINSITLTPLYNLLKQPQYCLTSRCKTFI